MKKEIIVGQRDAILELINKSNLYEIVVAFCYDKKSQTWEQGHYFTLSGKVTAQDKVNILQKALELWNENEYK